MPKPQRTKKRRTTRTTKTPAKKTLTPTRRKTTAKKNLAEDWNIVLDRKVIYEVLAMIAFLSATLLFLALFNLAGTFGNAVQTAVLSGLGLGSYLLILLLFAVAAGLLLPERDDQPRIHKLNLLLGSILTFLPLAGLVHLPLPQETYHQALEIAQEGKGGGLLGLLVSYPLRHILGDIATTFVLTTIALIGLQISFAFSWGKIILWTWEHLIAPVWNTANGQPQILIQEKTDDNETPSAPETTEDNHEPDLSTFTQPQEPTTEQEPLDDHINIKTMEPEIAATTKFPTNSPANNPNTHISWQQPPVYLLDKQKQKPGEYGDPRGNAKVIEETLASFGVQANVVEANCGPSVTQFAVKPAKGVRVARIMALQNDLTLALSAASLRVEAPIPSRPYVGIEIPNPQVALVTLREIVESKEFVEQMGKNDLLLALGRDVSGKPVVGSLAKMPHLLVAGATGSGKSVCSNTMLCSLLYQYAPTELKFILIDPKVVELAVYNGIPHLLAPVITDPVKTMSALKWAVKEMERRYAVFAEDGHRNLKSYNTANPEEKMPFIVILIEEFADLMMVAPAELEASIQRLAQKARATGIHLICSTQRPSANVITGVIKANIPARIAFSVASQIDSRVILDMQGAEKLLGQGDMLFLAGDVAKPKRVQGVYVSDGEINKIVDFLKNQGTPEFSEEVLTQETDIGSKEDSGSEESEEFDDDMMVQAIEIVLESGKASTSYLQRRLKIGYARAARLMDVLEEKGVVGPGTPGSSKPREVYMSRAHELIG